MSPNKFVTHFIVSKNRYRCGKIPAWNSAHSSDFSDVTCKTCLESHKFENGKIREYKLGGNYGKDKKIRKHSNHWDYKKENLELKSEIKKLKLTIKKMKELIND